MEPMEEIAQALKELNATTKKALEVQGLAFALEPTRYIARKLRSGEAISDTGSWYLLIAPGATFNLVAANPTGYVWIGLWELWGLSQEGVIEFSRWIDDELMPGLYMPRSCSGEFNWATTIPFGVVARETLTIACTNHDAAAQWITAVWIGAYLRKEVWERDSKYMDLVAEKYMYPVAPPPEPL